MKQIYSSLVLGLVFAGAQLGHDQVLAHVPQATREVHKAIAEGRTHKPRVTVHALGNLGHNGVQLFTHHLTAFEARLL